MAQANIFSDVVCELGEGPSYDLACDRLFWFDIVGRKLLEKRYPDGPTIVHDLPFMASAIATVDVGRQLVVAEDGLYVRDAKSGALSLHTALEADKPLNRSNDARAHPSGAFWIGTMAKRDRLNTGAIYRFFKGELERLYDHISTPNSICFSPDGATAYFTGIHSNIIHRVDCDPKSGRPSGEPRVFASTVHVDGWVDGSVVDADGILWNARWGGARVDAYAPDGKLLRSIAVPVTRPSCPAFVGPDAARIAVTSAWKGMDAATRAVEPDAGKTFLLDVKIRGQFEPNVLI